MPTSNTTSPPSLSTWLHQHTTQAADKSQHHTNTESQDPYYHYPPAITAALQDPLTQAHLSPEVRTVMALPSSYVRTYLHVTQHGDPETVARQRELLVHMHHSMEHTHTRTTQSHTTIPHIKPKPIMEHKSVDLPLQSIDTFLATHQQQQGEIKHASHPISQHQPHPPPQQQPHPSQQQQPHPPQQPSQHPHPPKRHAAAQSPGHKSITPPHPPQKPAPPAAATRGRGRGRGGASGGRGGGGAKARGGRGGMTISNASTSTSTATATAGAQVNTCDDTDGEEYEGEDFIPAEDEYGEEAVPEVGLDAAEIARRATWEREEAEMAAVRAEEEAEEKRERERQEAEAKRIAAERAEAEKKERERLVAEQWERDRVAYEEQLKLDQKRAAERMEEERREAARKAEQEKKEDEKRAMEKLEAEKKAAENRPSTNESEDDAALTERLAAMEKEEIALREKEDREAEEAYKKQQHIAVPDVRHGHHQSIANVPVQSPGPQHTFHEGMYTGVPATKRPDSDDADESDPVADLRVSADAPHLRSDTALSTAYRHYREVSYSGLDGASTAMALIVQGDDDVESSFASDFDPPTQNGNGMGHDIRASFQRAASPVSAHVYSTSRTAESSLTLTHNMSFSTRTHVMELLRTTSLVPFDMLHDVLDIHILALLHACTGEGEDTQCASLTHHIQTFRTLGRTFTSIQAMVMAIQHAEQTGIHVDDDMCHAIRDALKQHGILSSTTLTPQQVEQVILASGGLESTVARIHAIASTSYINITSVPILIDIIKTTSTPHERIRTFLATTTLLPPNTTLTHAHVEALLTATKQDMQQLMLILHTIADDEQHLATPANLIATVSREYATLMSRSSTAMSMSVSYSQFPMSSARDHRTSITITPAARTALRTYLSSTSCALLSSFITITDTHLDSILSLSQGDVATTIKSCEVLNAGGYSFESVADLIDALDAYAAREPQSTRHGYKMMSKSFSTFPVDKSSSALPVVAEQAPQAQPQINLMPPATAASISYTGINTVASSAASTVPPTPAPATASPEAKALRKQQRSQLFDYLAQPTTTLFRTPIQLNNVALDSMLSAGGDDVEQTIAICTKLNSEQKHYTDATTLSDAIRQRRTTSIPATPSSPSTSKISPQRKAQRDQLFNYLSQPSTSTLFSSPVSLNNKSLDALIDITGDVTSTSDSINVLVQQEKSFASVDALIEAVKVQHVNKGMISPKSQAPLLSPPKTATSIISSPPKTASTLDLAIRKAYRDRLFEHLSSPSCTIFATPITLNNKALDAILAATDDDVEVCITRCQTLQKHGNSYSSVETLVADLAKKDTVISPVTSPTASKPTTASPASIDKATRTSHRDRLFTLLADPTCPLFSSPVTLNNKALDAMLNATGDDIDICLERCRALCTRGNKYATVDELVTALTTFKQEESSHTKNTISISSPNRSLRKVERDQLFEFLSSPSCVLFHPTAKVVIANAQLDALLTEGGTLSSTLLYCHTLNAAITDKTQQPYPSCDALVTAIAALRSSQQRDEAAKKQSLAINVTKADRDVVFTCIAEPPSLFTSMIALGSKDLTSIIHAAGGVPQAVKIIRTLQNNKRVFPSVQHLVTAIETNDTASLKEETEEDDISDEEEDDDVVEEDQVEYTLDDETKEQLRREEEMSRLDEEDAKREAGQKMPPGSFLCMTMGCRNLPRMDSIGSSDPYIEIYRYRAYQDKVSAVVWEQMKKNLWEKEFTTERKSNTLNPDFLTTMYRCDKLCCEEYDRPLQFKVWDWNRSGTADLIGCCVTSLREVIAHAQSSQPFELINEEQAKSNRRYKNSGYLIIGTARVLVPRQPQVMLALMHATQIGMTPAHSYLERSRAITRRADPNFTGHQSGVGIGESCETTCLVQFKIHGSKLEKKDLLGLSDPFYQIHSQNQQGEWNQIYQSDVIEHTLDPSFPPSILSLDRVCDGDFIRPLWFRVFDWDKGADAEIIGEFVTTLRALLEKRDHKWTLVNPKSQKSAGTLFVKPTVFSDYSLQRRDADIAASLIVCIPPNIVNLQSCLPSKIAAAMAAEGSAVRQRRAATKHSRSHTEDATDLKLAMMSQNNPLMSTSKRSSKSKSKKHRHRSKG